MKRTGEILRQAREKNGYSLHEIGLHIKINNKILKAIEDGDTSKLPAKTFLRGFVRSYASFLKLNIDEVMTVFHEEMGSTKPNVSTQEIKQSQVSHAVVEANQSPKESRNSQNEDQGSPKANLSEENKEISSESQQQLQNEEQNKLQGDLVYKIEKKRNALAMTVAGIAVALVLVVVGINKIIEKYTKESEPNQVTVQEPIDQADATQQAAEATTENLPADQAAVEQNKNQAVDIQLVTPQQQNPDGVSVNKPIDIGDTQKTTPPSPQQAQAPIMTPVKQDNSATIEKKIETDRNKPVELIVEAASDVEIKYSTLSGKIEIVKLKADQVHTFKSKQGLKVSISDAGAVNLILNGRDIGSPGGKGKQVNLSY